MEIFNIGPLELIIVLVIMFVLLGPDEMKRTARRIAVSIRKFVRSPIWADITGMREEIRELPKRLIEDTGLEEAVQDIKQTTTAASEEVNAAVKESVEAARVREVEHLRLETSKKLSPKAGQVIMPPRISEQQDTGTETVDAESEAQEPAEEAASASPVSAMDDAAAYALEVDISPAQREPAQDQPIADTVNTIMPPAEVAKKPRRKKVEAPAAADAKPAETEGEEPAPKPRRAPRRKTEPQPTTPGSNGSGAENTALSQDETNESNAA